MRRQPFDFPLWCLLGWAGLHVLTRILISPSLELDEAEQIVWSQSLLRGYGAQPPLYTWLQWCLVQVLGPTVLALSTLKVGLIALTLWLALKTGRLLLPEKAALVAAAGMLLLPSLVWESFRDLTHTVLLTCMVVATWYLLVRQVLRPGATGFVLLGMALGLGMLSKYSFGLFALALSLSALSIAPVRQALLARGWWLAPLVALALNLPHGWWLFSHWRQASDNALTKLQAAGHYAPWLGIASLAEALAGVLLPWLLIMSWAFFVGRGRLPTPDVDAAPDTVPAWTGLLFRRYFLLVLGMLAALILLGGATSIKGRWLYPLFCIAPVAWFTAFPGLAQRRGARRYLMAAAALALLAWLTLVSRPWINGQRMRPNELNEPIVALAQALHQQGYDGKTAILGSDRVVAGALRTRFPSATVQYCEGTPERVAACLGAAASTRQEGRLIVSRSRRLPEDWWPDVTTAFGAADAVPVTIELPYLYLPPEAARGQYKFLWLPATTPP